jgi:hypothetical protein
MSKVLSLMKIYKVKDKYKSTQKTHGKIIPYEKIEKSLYSNSFLTSEKRIYYWIAAVADVLLAISIWQKNV